METRPTEAPDQKAVENYVADVEHFKFWERDTVLARAAERFNLRFGIRNALISFAPMFPFFAFQSWLDLREILIVYGILFVASWLGPQAVIKIVLEGKGYGELPFMQRNMLFTTSLGHLRRIPRRDELLVIPDMREDAKSIFFLLTYWIYPRERA